MHVALRRSSLSLVLLLAACSADRGAVPAPAASAPAADAPFTAQEFEAFKAGGMEQATRKVAPYDYWLHYKLMDASGMVAALGGEDRAIAALKALGVAYEQRAKAFVKDDAPKMVPAGFDGNGIDAGYAGLGMGAFAGMLTGGMLNGAASQMSDEQLRDIASRGPIKFDGAGGSAEWNIGEDGSVDQSMEFPVKGIEGIDGRVKVKTRMEACPDPQGKVTVDLEIESNMSVSGKPGTGGAIKAKLRYARYLDDDAHLIEGGEGAESDIDIDISGTGEGGNKHASVSQRWTRDGKTSSHSNGESGYSIFNPDEVQHTQDMLAGINSYMSLIAEALLRGSGKQAAWESGRCVKLEVRADPAKRKGAKPNTAYTLFAEPRAKSDGMPAGGTVKATLNGGSRLNPTSKVKADAKFDYANPDKKDQVASIDFEARSKRGVGKATLDFDTKAGGYRIVLENGDAITTCDITKPFSGKIAGGMITLSFTPAGDRGGKVAWHFAGGGGVADTSYDYTLSGPEDSMTGSFVANAAICGQGSGLKRCAMAREQRFTSTWTRIEDCGGAQ